MASAPRSNEASMVNQYLIVIDPKQRQNEKRNIIKNHELNHPPDPYKYYFIPFDVSRLVFHRIYGA